MNHRHFASEEDERIFQAEMFTFAEQAYFKYCKMIEEVNPRVVWRLVWTYSMRVHKYENLFLLRQASRNFPFQHNDVIVFVLRGDYFVKHKNKQDEL